MKIHLFISYSHQDESYRNELEKHLSILRDNGEISDWSDRKILPGQEWDKSIKKELENAQVILFLVSPDFIASNYCKEVELKRAIERHDAKEAVVIPIIIRYCSWEKSPLGKLQALPIKDGHLKPIKGWDDIDEAFYFVVKGIEKVIGNIDKDIKKKKQTRTWADYKKELITKGRYFYISPWMDSGSEEEHEFKKLLKGKAEESVKLYNQKNYEAILKLWEPLVEKKLFDINIDHWRDRPFFRRYIHAGKSDIFVAHASLAGKNFDKENCKKALDYLDELLHAAPYSLKGPSQDKLQPKEAKFENEEAIKVMNFAKSFIEAFSVKGLAFMTGKDEFTIENYLERIDNKINIINYVNSE